MAAGAKLAKAIKDNRNKESDLSDLVYGQVLSTSPLKIRVESRFEITSNFIELSQMVKDKKIKVTIDGKSTTITIFESLKVGDKVRMLRAQKSQKFYVLERV